jgi:hypothetical protein
VRHHKRARAACRYWREEVKEGGCDQPILLGEPQRSPVGTARRRTYKLGNDPLYGGLGGEFTCVP